jgi:hypothetical protein
MIRRVFAVGAIALGIAGTPIAHDWRECLLPELQSGVRRRCRSDLPRAAGLSPPAGPRQRRHRLRSVPLRGLICSD